MLLLAQRTKVEYFAWRNVVFSSKNSFRENRFRENDENDVVVHLRELSLVLVT